MSLQSVYDAVRNWLGLGPNEPVVITIETPAIVDKAVDAFDFRSGRSTPTPQDTVAPLPKSSRVRVRALLPPGLATKLKRKKKK